MMKARRMLIHAVVLSMLSLGCAGLVRHDDRMAEDGLRAGYGDLAGQPDQPRELAIAQPSDRRPPVTIMAPPRRLACEDVAALARDVAPRLGLDAALLVGVAYTESRFIVNAVSPAFAVGLVQVIPRTADAFGCGDLYDPAQAMECGARVLVRFLERYDWNLIQALAAYNGGHRYGRPAQKEGRLPSNMAYVTGVLYARGVYLRKGCKALEPTPTVLLK